MIRLAIAEDHQSMIDGMQLLLKYESEIEIVGAVNDGQALLKLVRLKQPHVVITDIRMPKMDGIAATEIIKKEFPHTKVLAFTMLDETDFLQQMLDAGANGYLLKDSPLEEIINAIQAVYKGNSYFDANITANIEDDINKKAKGVLTKRQREILKWVARGKTSSEIADLLFIGTHCVNTHRKNMVRILGLKGKGALLRYALEKKYG